MVTVAVEIKSDTIRLGKKSPKKRGISTTFDIATGEHAYMGTGNWRFFFQKPIFLKKKIYLYFLIIFFQFIFYFKFISPFLFYIILYF